MTLKKQKAIKTSNFSMRIAPQTKSELEYLFKSLGMTVAEAVNIFFAKALLVGGMPFDVRTPEFNDETMKAIQETLDIKSGKIQAKRYKSVEEMFADDDENA